LWRRGHAGRAHCISAQSSYCSMASPPRIFVEFLRRFLPTKHHIKRFLRCWTSLLAFLAHKMGEWRFLWLSKPGMIRSPKPPEPSFPSDRAGSASVPGGSVCTCGISGYVVAASTVPASANQPPGRERAERPEPQSDTTPPTSTLATIPVDLPEALGPSTINQTGESSHDNHSSGNLSVQSRASDRLSTISTSRASLRALVQNDQLPQDHRVTYGQLGPGLDASQLIDRSSRSPSPQPSLNTAQPDNLDTTLTGLNSSARAGRVINMTFGLQGLTDLPSSFSDTQERPGRPAIRPQKQRTTSIILNVQNSSTESLQTTSINAQEITEEPIAVDTSTHVSHHISPSDRAEAASQNSPTTSSAASVPALPEGHILRLINSDQIPRYTKNNTMQVGHHIMATRPLHMLADLVREN
jgi:hypothetical protein